MFIGHFGRLFLFQLICLNYRIATFLDVNKLKVLAVEMNLIECDLKVEC